MRRSWKLAVALFFLAGMAQGRQIPSAVQERIDVLDYWISTRIHDEELPSITIAVVDDQRIVWSKAYGLADVEAGRPATTRTLYRIASVTKLFTASAILQLRDAGKLQLDDPVAKHLPSFRPKDPCAAGATLRSNAQPIDCADQPPITIRQLLTHTSGLPREGTSPYWNDLDFPTEEELLRELQSEEAIHEPGTDYKYSNLGVSLLGQVVEAVSGERWATYVRRHILDPLGMTATEPEPRPDNPLMSQGYGERLPGKGRDRERFVDSRGLAASANIASNVEEMAKFLALQFRSGAAGGSQILRGSTLREMQRVHWLNSSWSSGRGLGWAIRRVENDTRVWHSGSVNGFRSYVVTVPAKKIGVVVLANAEGSDPGRFADQALAIVAPAIVASRPAAPRAAADPAWRRYVGDYSFERDRMRIMLLDGRLAMVDPTDDNPWESRVVLEPVSENVFREVGGGSNGELLRFEVDAAGKVTRVWDTNFYWWPAKRTAD